MADGVEDLSVDDSFMEVNNGDIKEVKPKGNKRLSVERIYQKKTQLEHILLRPDTYIGSVEPVNQTMWVYDGDEIGMVSREITFVPGLYKIFDEILVNAADNKQRDKNMDCIKIEIDPEKNKISIWNNGRGIPVVEHKDEKMFVPSLIFGHLLTSSNYNDEEKKVTGGRNGYGAKLCNIFSTKFSVETSSKQYGKCFKQVWTDNMNKTTEPKITPNKGQDFTCVTFYPDLSKFKMDILDKDIVALMSRRAFDVAGCTKGVKVYLNGKRLPVKGFKEYVEQYLKNKEDEQGNSYKVIHECVNDRWEVAVTLSDRGFQQVSFVNSIATTKGGRHVDYVTDQLTAKIVEVVKKKNKKGKVNVKQFQVKNHIWVFVNCLIENPTFDSQTKENMTLQPKSFGSKCQLSDKYITLVLKCGIVEAVMSWVQFKAQNELNQKCSGKKKSKLKGIPKLEDANDAGTKNSIDCTLILTEGDSAKTLAVSGLGVVGRDKYGVFPLRGKMLNVREATHKQILENAEINNVIKIMGLQYKKKYENVEDLKTLRYGRLMIMTDQDQDGSHIKGLVINFIHHNWPSLLRLPFLEEFITPIVKATKGKEERAFYSLPEFEEWKSNTPNWPTWKVKYYKGLGTSTAKEAKEYFSDMLRHRIKFRYQGTDDDHAIQLAFSKKMVDLRKEWLTNGMEERKRRRELGLPELYLYGKSTTYITYNDFVNKELILFSNMDNERSIPSLVDGLKPGQRKVVYTCIKRNDKREIKVAQLAGSVAEHSAYHHGEQALMGTIINLAQNFVGSNNINILQPIGQFGTRLQGGKDAASPRYIFTLLSPLAKHIFPSLDEPLLKNLYDDNQKIEPEYYVPIIPMVLVNGTEGIGTGWSTKVPNYNPREIVANLRRLLNGEEQMPLKPWFKNFKGGIEQLDSQRFVVNGEIAELDVNKIEITELPVRTWTQTYKENVLELMLHGTEKSPPLITDYKEYHTDTTVRFVITLPPEKMAQVEQQGFHKVFKLQTCFSTSSMVLFDSKGCLRKYETPEQILKEFFDVRFTMYERRKEYLEGILGAETLKLENQARFILEKIENKIVIENRKKLDMIRTLQERNYDSDPVKAWKEAQKNSEKEENELNSSDSEDEDARSLGPDYDYLLGMSLWSLTREKKEELLKKRDDKRKELSDLQKKSPKDLWEDDLDKFAQELDQVEQKEREDELAGVPSKIKVGKLGGGKSRAHKLAEETKPSPLGTRIIPRIDAEMRRKVEKAPGPVEGKRKGRPKKEGDSKKDDDDDDEEPLPLSERLGNSPEKLKETKVKKTVKQGTINFKSLSKKTNSPKSLKKGKKNPWSESESEKDVSDVSDIEEKDYIPPEKREIAPRRAAAKAKYTFESEEENDKSDDQMFSNFPPSHEQRSRDVSSDDDVQDVSTKKTKPIVKKTIALDNDEKLNGAPSPPLSDSDDSDDLLSHNKPTEKPQESLFDSLLDAKNEEKNEDVNILPACSNKNDSDSDSSIGLTIENEKKEPVKAVQKKRPRKKSSSSSDDDFKPKPKKVATAPKKPAAVVRKKKTKHSDSEDVPPRPTKTKKPKKKPAVVPAGSDDENIDGKIDDDDDDSMVIPRARAGRSRAPVKYNFGEDSSEEDF